VVRDGDGEPAIRVLAVVHCYPPAIGGVERAMRDILDGLVTDHGFDVTVLTTDAMSVDGFRDRRLPRITSSEATAGGALVRRFSVCSRVCRLLYRAQFVAWRFRVPGNDWLRTWGSGPISPGLRRAARRLDADVIFVASFPLNHVFYALGRRDAVPVVVMPAAHPADRWGYERPNLLRATRGAFATVALSSHEADWLADRGIARERVKLIPLGLDPSALREEPCEKGTATVARRQRAVAGESGSPGQGFETATVPAAADDRRVVGHLDMTDVPGTARRSSMELAVDEDARANARTDLDEDRCVMTPGDTGTVFAEGHQVDVVVHPNGNGVASAEPFADRIIVPAGHDRRGSRPPGCELDRSWDADPDPPQVAERVIALRAEPGEQLVDAAENRLRPGGDISRLLVLLHQLAGQVRDANTDARGSQVGDEDVACAGVQSDRARGSASR